MKRSIPFVLAVLAIVAACQANNANGPFTGTVKGKISDTAGSALSNVRVVIQPPAGDSAVIRTGSDGSWEFDNVPIGVGRIEVESLPPDCDTQPAFQYALESPGTTTTLTLRVTCSSSHQVVAGRGDLDGGAVNEVRRDAPRRMLDMILDRRSIALPRVAPVPLGDERRL